MEVYIENIVSISEVNQNFSKVAHLVDEKGLVIILKNNTPRYVLLDYNMLRQNAESDDEDVSDVTFRMLEKYIKELNELAK
ncbi:MAG: type II toxin-antitoxin system Phd/YefM family antitoxin [Oscillospiraceae bacterium]|nr:type II toxin-antitoxin system Phd/YefM family antitoxin [Oscillospiraceae bacterium]